MKPLPWLLVPEGSLSVGARVALDDVETRHVRGPLRLASGQRVVLADGAGAVATGELGLPRRGAAEVAVETLEHVPKKTTGLTLAVGILAGVAMDMVVQKAVELGVLRLVPVACGRSQLSDRRAAARAEHWNRIGRQALKQCRRPWAIELAPALTLTGLVDGVGAERGVVADPCGSSVTELRTGRDTVLLVGPEGGFTPEEERVIGRAGWQKLWLGAHVLRAETAAIAGAAVLVQKSSFRVEEGSDDD